ncbi:hypothetical protein [Candidatus Cyanaurora vandensis]|uniref:hypothetical protein n=1 Tax=Candidatus Cyanaurora vandensis TaxID=2714958 RepID=UPI00257AFC1B|nr:hypothetical protein [Candidatus Cyanaurora vandensis]
MKFTPTTTVLYYVGMTGLLIGSFTAIVNYGTAHLKAPQSISGKYRLAMNLSCLGQAPPLLVIGQSGSYLNADLLASDSPKDRLSRAFKGNGTIHGKIDGTDSVNLTGSMRCPGAQPVTVAATFQQGKVRGTLAFKDQVIPFSGQIEPT